MYCAAYSISIRYMTATSNPEALLEYMSNRPKNTDVLRERAPHWIRGICENFSGTKGESIIY